jgi:fermentation-respiration switch protein FrsA (DUF1100 family)
LTPDAPRKRKLHPMVRILILAACAYAGLVILVAVFQRRLQYFPFGGVPRIPGGEAYRAIEEVEVVSRDGIKLRGWYWPGTMPVTVYVLHGNAGHRGHRIDWLAEVHSRGASVFILDYRGYGGSDGSPTEEGLYLDAEAGARWLAARGAGKVVYFGESLGSAVAVELALRAPPAAMVLQAGFPSATSVARRAYPFLPVGLLLRDRFEAAKRIRRVACPILFIHGNRDSIVPVDLGRALHDSAPGPKEWFEVNGADHNDIADVGGAAYFERIAEFLRRVAG